MRDCPLDDFRRLLREMEAAGQNIDCNDLDDDQSLRCLRRRMTSDIERDFVAEAAQRVGLQATKESPGSSERQIARGISAQRDLNGNSATGPRGTPGDRFSFRMSDFDAGGNAGLDAAMAQVVREQRQKVEQKIREEVQDMEQWSTETVRSYFMMEAVAKAHEHGRDPQEVMQRFGRMPVPELERLRQRKLDEIVAKGWR